MTADTPWLLPLAGSDARSRAEGRGTGGIRSGGPQRKCMLKKTQTALKDPASQLPEKEPHFVGFPSLSLLLLSTLPLPSATPTRSNGLLFR